MKYNPKLPDQVLLTNGQWNATCPFCSKPGHFYMNSKNGLFDCKKCGEVGNWFKYSKFIKTGIVDEEEKKLKKNLLKVDFDLVVEDKKEVEEEQMPILTFPEEFANISKTKTPRAYKYLIKERKFTLSQLNKYNILYCDVGRYWNRIIIPVYMFGQLYGYMGRFIPIQKVKVKRKYLNSYGTDFSKLLWNYDRLNPDKVVILTEGSFGGMRIDDNVTCTFGKKISKYQVELLKLKNIERILLLYDADALSEINKYGGKLLEDFKEVRVLPLKEGQDIDDFENEDGKLYRKILSLSEHYKYAHLVSLLK